MHGLLYSLAAKRGQYLVLALLTTLLVSASLMLGAVTLYANGTTAKTRHAALVVQAGDGSVINKCVEFTENQISGLDLLTRAGLDVKVDAGNAMGVAVCKIGGDGCNFPNKPCFCKCQGADCTYWSYWHMQDGAWKYQDMGTSNTVIHNGDVDGWVWGPGTTSGASPPALVSFDQICAVADVTDTPTPTETIVTATTKPTRTASTTPTVTQTRTLTATPSQTATARPTTHTPEIFPTNTRRPVPTVHVESRPIPTQVPFVPTEPPPPTEQGTPYPTILPTRPPTRVAINSSSGTTPNGGQETEVQHDETDLRTGRVLGLVLLGGIGVAGVGLFALVGGVVWYVYRRR